ncbi:MAG: hypothetical protein Aurels2KO_43720 [Aureliella sp.]
MPQSMDNTADLTESLAAITSGTSKIAGRYEVRDRLGVGGMSEVYLAHDAHTGEDVAIKFMKSELSGSARRRFFREFNTIAGIKHPCCLQVFEIGETDQGPYFTMELHPGRNASSILGEPPESIAPMLVDLTLAVDYIHSQGIVHRDVKPSNIMVQRTGGKGDGRLTCKLADFGLAKFYQLDSSLTNERGIVGTPAYCAPEQVDGFEVDHRVDLYAIGILAYELLSGGKHPFARARGEGMHALLHAQLRTRPAPLNQANPNISEELSSVIDSYLAKEADARPSSGAALRTALCAHYGIEVESRLEELSSPSDVVLNAVGFVCREPELKLVDNFLSQRPSAASDPANSRALVPFMMFTGESGTGKTSTMQEAMRRATGRGHHVYEGRCFDGSTGSLQPVVTIIRHILASHARNQRTVEESTLLAEYNAGSDDLDKMFKILQNYRDELLLISPDLRRWLNGNRELPALDNDPNYMVRALSQLYLELSQVAPLCICFEDIQWADHTTLAFLSQLSVSIAAESTSTASTKPVPPLLIMATARSGYPKTDQLIAKLQPQRLLSELHLVPLTTRETRELVALRLGCLPATVTEELVEAIDRLCNGNPFFVSETIREWHSRGFIVKTTDGWQRVHGTIDDESSLPSTIRSAMKMRVSELSDDCHTALGIAAVIGRVIDLDLLTDACEDLSEPAVLDAVDELLAARILAETSSANRLTFTHDLLRESILGELSAGKKRGYHRLIANLLEMHQNERGDVPHAILAGHFLAGGQEKRAFEYYVEAASRAAESYAFIDALEYTKNAKRIIPTNAPAGLLFKLYEAETRSAFNTAAPEVAQDSAETALGYAETAVQKGRSMLFLARIQTSIGHTANSINWHDSALKALGVPRPRSKFMQIAKAQYNLFAFHFLPTRTVGWLNRTKGREAEHALACEVLYSLSHVLVSLDMVGYTEACTANIRLARSLDNHGAKACAYAKYGLNLAFSGLNRPLFAFGKGSRALGVRYGEMGYEEAQHDSRAHIDALAATSAGLAYYCAGQLDAGEEILLRAQKMLRRVRDLHTAYCYHALRHIASIRGIPGRILEFGKLELATAEETGASEIIAWGNFGLSHGYTMAGMYEQAIAAGRAGVAAAKENQSNFQTVASMELGTALMHSGDYPGAIEELRRADSFIRKRLFFFEVAVPAYPRLVEAYLGPDWRDGSSKTCNTRRAKWYARHSSFFAFSFPNIVPVNYRVQGRLAFARGKQAKARNYFAKSLVAAKDLGAKYDEARALIDYGQAFPNESNRVDEGRQILHEIGAVLPRAEELE